MKRRFSVYELLAKIRARPAMYFGECSLIRLHSFLSGCSYLASEPELEIEQPDALDFHGFHDWVAAKYGWRESTAGWCNIILRECGDDDRKALETFFELFDEYRRTAEGAGRVE